jgi:hypothetical protein
MAILSGRVEGMPYSLSRWTDIPAAKWPWFKEQLKAGHMIAFDPRTAVPGRWSLAPDDTMGLIFWTKNPMNLIADQHVLRPYQSKMVVHLTITGWVEMEKGAPDVSTSIAAMIRLLDIFGPDGVVLRFSPIPMVPDVVERFARIAKPAAAYGIKHVYVIFLQENDLVPETRSVRVRREVLRQMAAAVPNITVALCREDRTLDGGHEGLDTMRPLNLQYGVCESGQRFYGETPVPDTMKEGCGCCLAVDPFTINESCTLRCAYCYAADKSLAPKKRNTTKRGLPVL